MEDSILVSYLTQQIIRPWFLGQCDIKLNCNFQGSIGGPAARLAQDCIKNVEVLEYPEVAGNGFEIMGKQSSLSSLEWKLCGR